MNRDEFLLIALNILLSDIYEHPVVFLLLIIELLLCFKGRRDTGTLTSSITREGATNPTL
jgi:hypothetical protein